MERNTLIWLGAFALLAVLEITGEGLDQRSLILYTKPLLMPVLAVWLLRRTPGIRRFFRHTILFGLLFATLGDVLLMFAGGKYDSLFFLMGLGAFLITHLCYLGGFLSEVSLKSGYLRREPLWVIPFLVFLAGFLYWLWPGIPEGMRQPVSLYALVISAMAVSVLNTKERMNPEVFSSLMVGALLFMLSDCLIAVYRFGYPVPGARVLIMLTYITGQWLIVRGVAERLRRFPEKPQRAER